MVVLAALSLFLSTSQAWAHRIDEYLQATLVSLQAKEALASMRLIPGVLVAPSVIAAIDRNRDGSFSEREKEAYAQRVLGDLSLTLDGTRASPQLLSWSFPEPAAMKEGLGEIQISYRVDLPPGGQERALVLVNHHLSAASVYLVNAVVPQDRTLHILAQRRNELQSVYELDYQQQTGQQKTGKQQTGDGVATSASPAAKLGTWWSGLQLASLFHLGMRHIAEGTDHLLFLLVLLLPAPLLAAGTRWDRPAGVRQSLLHILGIVTAFTLGHSLTLSLAAMEVVQVPERPIEVLIAVSILVSAVHALRPLFPGREAWIAGFFGLIHGLAFAATLSRLGLARWDRVAGILAFNLGIETMQMLIVAVVLPSLLLLSRTRAYPVVRSGGAIVAGSAALGWIVERLFNVSTPVSSIVDIFARHAVWAAVALFLLSLACRYLPATWLGRGDSQRRSRVLQMRSHQ